MLRVSGISKSYGALTVLDSITFVLHRGERVGLVGPNGGGKTTLLRIVAGLETPDAGNLSLEGGATLGYLPQGQEAAFGATVGAVLASGQVELGAARDEMDRLASRMAQGAVGAELLDEYARAVAQFEALGGYEAGLRVEQVKRGLGLHEIAQETKIAQLSGGQRTRLGLARLLVSTPGLLLLDEPTNHLDVGALEWLEGFLRDYTGGALVVSHDRTFLDHTVTRILELDDRTHKLASFAGNYSAYLVEQERARAQQLAEWQDQQEEVARLKAAAAHLRGIARFRKGGKADTGDKFAKGFFANRSLETVRRAKQIERRVERLTTQDRIDKPETAWKMRIEFGEMPRSGQRVLSLENLGHAFDGRWLFRGVSLLARQGERIAVLGPNGTGKTTLFRLIAGQLFPSEGEIHLGANVQLGYMPQEQEDLDPAATPLSLVRGLVPFDETQARRFLHLFLFSGDEVFTRIGEQSYGERARLLLARLVLGKANLLILDEPINHLDIPSRERFETALDAFPGTILVAAHDRAFINRFATSVWSLEDGTIRSYPDLAAMKRR